VFKFEAHDIGDIGSLVIEVQPLPHLLQPLTDARAKYCDASVTLFDSDDINEILWYR